MEISNRVLKAELIGRFGDHVCFMYSKEKAKSQMFFSTSLKAPDIAETVRRGHEYCLRKGSPQGVKYDFSLEGSYKDADDLKERYELYRNNRPSEWQTIPDQLEIPAEEQVVCDMIFQIFYSLIHVNANLTPFIIGLTQTIHDTCRSKHLIVLLSRLKICASCDSMERTDTG